MHVGVKTTVGGIVVKGIGPSALLSEEAIYAVVGTPKDHGGDNRIAFRGTYDDCADYVERNESLDNYERYEVVEVVQA